MSSEKDLRKLVNDIGTYTEEKKWLEHNPDELLKNGKISEKDAEGIKKRQEKATKRIRKLESSISLPLIRMFPQRFREKVPTEKIEEIGIVGDVEKGILPIGVGEEIIYEVVPEGEVPPPTPSPAPPIIKPEDVTIANVYNSLENLGLIIKDTSLRNYEAMDAFLTPLEAVKDLLQGEHDVKGEYFEILYPADGDTKAIPNGATEINFVTGDVHLGDGEEDKLSIFLDQVNKSYVRSVFVDTDKAFKVQLDDGAKESVEANDFYVRTFRQFQRLTIEVEETANMHLWVSTNPDGVTKQVRNVIIKGYDDGNEVFRTVALDSNGNIVGLFKGDYGGTLKTLAVDDQGRMLAVLTDPEDVFGNPHHLGAAELAARLGSIDTFERRGNVIWMDDFEAPKLKWVSATSGAGASVALSTAESLRGIQSVKLDVGTASGGYSMIYRYLAAPRSTTKVGFEFAFTTRANVSYIVFGGSIHDGVNKTFGKIVVDYSANLIKYTKSSNGGYNYIDTGLDPQLSNNTRLFHMLKFVFDYSTKEWERVFFDNEEADLTNMPMYTAADVTKKQTYLEVELHGDEVLSTYIYVDNVVITQNE